MLKIKLKKNNGKREFKKLDKEKFFRESDFKNKLVKELYDMDIKKAKNGNNG